MKVFDDIRKNFRRKYATRLHSRVQHGDLEEEAHFFELNRRQWADQGHEHEYVLIHKDEPQFFPTLRAAYDAGMTQIGITGFFIRQVTKEPPANYLPSVFEGEMPVGDT